MCIIPQRLTQDTTHMQGSPHRAATLPATAILPWRHSNVTEHGIDRGNSSAQFWSFL